MCVYVQMFKRFFSGNFVILILTCVILTCLLKTQCKLFPTLPLEKLLLNQFK